MSAKTQVNEESFKKYRKFSKSNKGKRKFQVWTVEEEKEWVVKENFDVETKTEGEAFEALQGYIAENFADAPCAVVCKVNALEGPDKRPSDKQGVLVWIPETCKPRLRFVTSQSQAALANKVVAKAWNCDDLSKITYANVLEQVGGTAASKQLYSVDPVVAADDDDDDDE